jgi:type VII secretion-associated protein (TIGR03931 family)
VDAGTLKPHRAVIEVGPAGVRRLCCAPEIFDTERAAAAVDAVDDAVALVDETPVRTGLLWRSVLRSLLDDAHTSLAIVHPSWWSTSRVAVLRCAADDVTAGVITRRRAELLRGAETVVVEIADRFVVITGAEVVAERRDGEPDVVAENVTRAVAGTTARTIAVDAPAAISGAAELAEVIAHGLRAGDADLTLAVVDDAVFSDKAVRALSGNDQILAAGSPEAAVRSRKAWLLPVPLRLAGLVGLVVLAAAVVVVGAVVRRPLPPTAAMPTTYLVEGRVALTVPAQWTTRRIVAGPGSARVQITSPIDPEVALHVTQSLVVDENLGDTAETLQRAIDEAPGGVFLDFNANGHSAGRAAVTYREVRAGHDIRWAVLLDGAVRISIGCQSRPEDELAVRDACELAVRSARGLK